ncbi:MAG: hypothetical protein ACLFSW_00800 [Halobacteriales archaeon]
MGVAEVAKRQATILGFVAVVLVLLFVAVAVVPFNLLPFYIGGWILTLFGTAMNETRIADGPAGAVPFVLNGVALFLFVAVAFKSFDFGNLPATAAGLVGVFAVVYSMSL